MRTNWLKQTIAVSGLLMAVPLPAWPEELGQPVDSTASTHPTIGVLPPGVLPAAVVLPVAAMLLPGVRASHQARLDDPWLVSDIAVPMIGRELTCTPWSGTSICGGESAMLSDPWWPDPTLRAAAPESVPLEPVELSSVNVTSEAPSAPLEAVLPTAAEVWPHRPCDEPGDLGSSPPPPVPLDNWVVDLGVPEVPFD